MARIGNRDMKQRSLIAVSERGAWCVNSGRRRFWAADVRELVID
jgi:hypothetical protein